MLSLHGHNRAALIPVLVVCTASGGLEGGGLPTTPSPVPPSPRFWPTELPSLDLGMGSLAAPDMQGAEASVAEQCSDLRVLLTLKGGVWGMRGAGDEGVMVEFQLHPRRVLLPPISETL